MVVLVRHWVRYDHGLVWLGFSAQELARNEVLTVLDHTSKTRFIACMAIDVGFVLCEHRSVASGALLDPSRRVLPQVVVDP